MRSRAKGTGSAAGRRPSAQQMTRGRFRQGLAIKELLVVLFLTGGGGVCLTLLDPIDEEQRKVRAPQREPLMQVELDVSDEFVCLVQVDGFTDPESSVVSHYCSRLRFARRNVKQDESFLLDIVISEPGHWRDSCRCRSWDIVPGERLPEEVDREFNTMALRSRLRPEQVEIVRTMLFIEETHTLSDLPEALRRCVPSELQPDYVLVASRRYGLHNIADLEEFPLTRLATAIEAAAVEEGWDRAAPQLLRRSDDMRNLSGNQKQAIARSLILRLAAHLSDSTATSPASAEQTAQTP